MAAVICVAGLFGGLAGPRPARSTLYTTHQAMMRRSYIYNVNNSVVGRHGTWIDTDLINESTLFSNYTVAKTKRASILCMVCFVLSDCFYIVLCVCVHPTKKTHKNTGTV